MLDRSRVLCQKARQGSGLLSLLTDKQKAIELDRHHLRVVCGGRQWGKSTWNGVSKRRNAVAGETSLALAPTIHKARDLLWPICERLNREHDARIELRLADSQLVFPNGGKVQLLGLSTLAEAEKIRGFTPPDISIEECGTYRDELLSYAIDACAQPALMKWWRRGGRGLSAIGTPSKNIKTYWHSMCLGETGASVHRATVHDNPHIPDAAAYLRQVLYDHRKLGWTERTPEYRREYLGEFCADTESMPYGGWDGVSLPQKTAPAHGWTVMGVDFGQHQPNAWLVLRLTTERGKSVDGSRIFTMHKIHNLHAHKQAGMTTEQVASHTKALMARFHPNILVGDNSGGGAQSIADLQRVYQLPILPAKSGKRSAFKKDKIWMFGSMLSNQTIVCYDESKPWQDEARVMAWNEDLSDHHPGYPDHALDAGLYALEFLMAHVSETESEPMPGTPEWEERESKRRWDERLRWIRTQNASR